MMEKAEDFINMKVELIPVLEITNYDEDVPMPPSGPHWEFPDEWEDYHISSNIKAGFSQDLKPYFKSSSFYRINNISDSDVLKIIIKKTADLEPENDLSLEELISPLYGGYILKINDNNIYFPQCCSDLSNIESWEDLLSDDDHYFYMGHPSPKIEKSENKIIFDFLNSPIQESYAPPVLEERIVVDRELLKTAIDDAKKELHDFAQQLIRINISENLNIPKIDKILVYGRA